MNSVPPYREPAGWVYYGAVFEIEKETPLESKLEHRMKDGSPSPILRFLQGAACVVIIMWGIRAASSVLGTLLLGLLFAYAVVPFPNWVIRRFKLSKDAAIAVTAVAIFAFGFYLLASLDLASVRVGEKLPVYEQHLTALYVQVEAFVSTHGMAPPSLSVESVLTPERLRAIGRVVLPEAGAIISNGLLIFLLGFLFIIEMAEETGVKPSPLARSLAYYGSDSRSYVAVTAKTAGINALVNLVFLVVMGVDTPVVWSSLYFFLDFVPTLGYLIALVPPTVVTLLMYGWKRALVVACGLVLSNLIVDNVVSPIFMKQAVNVSFLEIMLSLVGWASLLGLTGAILAIPLTLGLKKFVAKNSGEEQLAAEPSG
jgi:AI-2 transport protein TqsA